MAAMFSGHRTILLCIMVGLGVWVMTTRIRIDSDPLSSRTQPPSLVDNGLDQIVPESETNIESRVEGGEKKTLTANRTAAIDESLSTQRLATGLYLYVQQTYVTLHAVDQSLKTVLGDLARETGIQINAELIADRQLTIRLDRLPIDRALRAILDSDDSFFAFEYQGRAPSALKAVWVLPAGMGGNWLPSTATCSQDIAALERQTLHRKRASVPRRSRLGLIGRVQKPSRQLSSPSRIRTTMCVIVHYQRQIIPALFFRPAS